MSFIKRNWFWLLAIPLLTYYGYYVGQARTVSWYDEHKAKAYLILRQQPDGKKFDPCMISVGNKNVISIMENGDLGANFDSVTLVHNCKFQWVMDNPRMPK